MSVAMLAAVEPGMPERPVPIVFVSFNVPGRVYGAKVYMDPEQAGKGEITIPHGILTPA